jgi:hypothetical protein
MVLMSEDAVLRKYGVDLRDLARNAPDLVWAEISRTGVIWRGRNRAPEPGRDDLLVACLRASGEDEALFVKLHPGQNRIRDWLLCAPIRRFDEEDLKP